MQVVRLGLKGERSIDLCDPDPDAIVLDDIARSLARIPRWLGHTSAPFTVAHHSLLVADLVSSELRFPALLHDGAEAYMGDLPAPLKEQEGMTWYREIEKKLQAAIYSRFGAKVDDVVLGAVKSADLLARGIEEVALRGAGSNGRLRELVQEYQHRFWNTPVYAIERDFRMAVMWASPVPLSEEVKGSEYGR